MVNWEIYFEVSSTKSFDVMDVIRKDQRCLLCPLLESADR